jgi:hypothetical protein
MCHRKLLSSTTRFPQTREMRSRFVTISGARSTSVTRMSRARLPILSGIPSFSRTLSHARKRRGPNVATRENTKLRVVGSVWTRLCGVLRSRTIESNLTRRVGTASRPTRRSSSVWHFYCEVPVVKSVVPSRWLTTCGPGGSGNTRTPRCRQVMTILVRVIGTSNASIASGK